MAKRRLTLALVACLVAGLASGAQAASTWKRLGANPFSKPLKSEADLSALVKDRAADLKAGFANAGAADLYPAFAEQFPTAKVETIKVAPGETFQWMLFKKRSNGRLVVSKDVTWQGKTSFDAYRFTIDKDGKRYEFATPFACGNFTLKSVAAIPPAPVAAAPAPPPPPPPPPPPAPAPEPKAVVAAPAPPPEPEPVAPPPPPPPAAVVAAPAPPPAPEPAPVAAPAPPPPPPAPAAKRTGGPLVDVGLARQFDPANYLFGRVGYELPLGDKLSFIGLLGGQVRWMGNDGGNAFTADALLDWRWFDKWSFGLGAGYWSGNDGQVDLLLDAGYLLSGTPEGKSTSLLIEARQPFDELDAINEFIRLGMGLRFRF